MMDERPPSEPVLLDDAWEPPPQPNPGRRVAIGAFVVIAFIVTGVHLLKSRERVWAPDDLSSWVPPPRATPPSAPSPAAGLRADLATAPTLSRIDTSEPNDERESPPRATPRPRTARATNRLPGYLSINSTPWAELAVDGHVVGNTPQVKIRVTAGRHHLLLARPGFHAHSAWVNVPAGGTVRLTDITLAEITW